MQDYEVDRLSEAYTAPDENEIDDTVRINRFFPAIKSQLPSLFFERPKFQVRPKQNNASEANELQAAIGEAVLDSIASREHSLETAARLAIQQSLFSVGVLKVVYDPRLRSNPQAGKPMVLMDDFGREVIDQVTGLATPMTDENGQQMREPRRIVTDEVYRWDWVNAANMIFPDQGPDRSKWTWIGEEIIVPIEVIKEDRRFSRAIRDQLKPNVQRRDESRTGVRALDDSLNMEDFGDFKYTEVWDIYNRRLYAFSDGVDGVSDRFMLNVPYPDGIEEHPYSILSYTPITDPQPRPWPMPQTYTWLSLDREYNVRRNQMLDGLARTARKIFYEKGAFSDEDSALAALSSSIDMEGVEVNDLTRKPEVVSDPPISASFSQDLAFLDREFNRTSGVVGARTGQRAGSATEASIEQQAGNLRDTDQRHLVSQWLATAGAKMFQLVKSTLTLDVWINLRGFTDQEFQRFVTQQYGEEFFAQMGGSNGLREAFKNRVGRDRWRQVTREDLEFEADIQIVPGSARPKTLETEREDILSFMTIIGANPQLAQSRELMMLISRTFEFVNEALVDELFALSQQFIAQQANQAGRNQGQGQDAGAQQNLIGALLNGAGG